ncbi:hypothetical protein B0H19DRAFT_1373407 [Mycena capillaripes]|nr:hypothetical protein B0H19DRAFT_1378714 [Mycena capillaripes]KAJ6569080.1 hypothetical protein B0H19DRAFT_1373407 [Mycena capillaripes]
MKTSALPLPSPSSHASSIVRATLRTPTPSPVPCPGAYDTSTSCDPAWHAIAVSTPPAPLYHYYGLANTANSEDSLDEEDRPRSRRVQSIVLPLPFPRTTAEPSDVFGTVRHNMTAAQHHKRRRAGAKLAAHVKRARTAAWVWRLCRDVARGGMLEEDNHSS